MNKPYISEEVDHMSDEQFLTKLKLVIDGKITNAAMLLLGNEDYDYLFKTVPEAAWRVYDSKNDVSDYEIFKIPYITLSERLFGKIRNLTYRYMPNQLTLFPTETKQYDMWLLRELLNNCIAHRLCKALHKRCYAKLIVMQRKFLFYRKQGLFSFFNLA